MEDLNSFFYYHQQDSIEEMKNKLRTMTYELQSTKMEAKEASHKHRENVKQLVHLLQTACKERDEARQQINKLFHSTTTTPIISLDQNSSVMVHGNTNSTITVESSDPTTPFNNNSQFSHTHSSSSPGGSVSRSGSGSGSGYGSLYDVVSPPHDFSSCGTDHDHSSTNYTGLITTTTTTNNFPHPEYSPLPATAATGVAADQLPPQCTSPAGRTHIKTTIDSGDLIFASIASATHKSLPQKGKLLQAVLEAGPLLQTLMIAGPIPRWRNPPPSMLHTLHRHHHTGYDTTTGGVRKGMLKRSYTSRESGGGGLSQGYGNSVLSFSSTGSAPGMCMGGTGMVSLSPREVFGFGYDRQQTLSVAKSQRIR